MDQSREASLAIADFHPSANPGRKLRSSSRIATYCASRCWAAFRTERWLKKQPRAPIDGNPAGSSGRIARKNSALHPTFCSCSSVTSRLSMRCSRLMTKISVLHVTTRGPVRMSDQDYIIDHPGRVPVAKHCGKPRITNAFLFINLSKLPDMWKSRRLVGCAAYSGRSVIAASAACGGDFLPHASVQT